MTGVISTVIFNSTEVKALTDLATASEFGQSSLTLAGLPAVQQAVVQRLENLKDSGILEMQGITFYKQNQVGGDAVVRLSILVNALGYACVE